MHSLEIAQLIDLFLMFLHTVEFLFIYVCNDKGFVHILNLQLPIFFFHRIVRECLFFGILPALGTVNLIIKTRISKCFFVIKIQANILCKFVFSLSKMFLNWGI